MTVFEPQTSSIGSDRSTNWAKTTAPILNILSVVSQKLKMASSGFELTAYSLCLPISATMSSLKR